MTYFDWAATSPPDPEILDEMKNVAERYFGNPSSEHHWGKDASSLLEECRSRCAQILGVKTGQIVFTSGASEANNAVLFSLLKKRIPGRLIISGMEHPSVLKPALSLKARGWEVVILSPGERVEITPALLEQNLTGKTALVAISGVDNESGAIQPLAELLPIVRKRSPGGHFHADLVQALGKIPLEVSALDSASMSGHKLRGPRGIGLLYLRAEREFLFCGGGQERGRRPGTENLPGIVGMTMAFERIQREIFPPLMARLKGMLETLPGACILPHRRRKEESLFSPAILSVAFPPLPGELVTRLLDEAGYGVSAGSACFQSKKEESNTLSALGVNKEEAAAAIRISLGPTTTEEEITALGRCLEEEILPVQREHIW